MSKRRVLAPRYKKAKAPGKELEGYVKRNLENLKQLGMLTYIQLKVDRSREKEPGDFLVKTPNGLWLFDTKECGEKRFYFTKGASTANQVKEMEGWSAMDTITGFLIWFTEADPCKQNLRFVTDAGKPADIASGKRFEFEMMLHAMKK